MDDLSWIINRCKGEVCLIVNEHRSFEQPLSQKITHIEENEDQYISPEIKARIMDTGTLIDLVCYPDNNIGSYRVIHHDLLSALSEMKRLIKEGL